MGIDAPLTVGIEEEFLLVHTNGQLAAAGPQISEHASPPTGQVEHELRRCQIESATSPSTELDEILADVRALRGRLATQAWDRRLRLLPSGTAPLSDDTEPRFTAEDRYQRIAREFGALAHQSLTCACHVHLGVPDRSAALVVSNGLRPWLPVLLALTANSPFHDGRDTHYASWRYMTWKRWPSAGPPPCFTSIDDYESIVGGLLGSGAILDRGMIYWDVRLSEHQPTVEVRISDVAATASEAVLFAALVRALASAALDGALDNVPPVGPDELRGRLWRAARDGLAGRCVDPCSASLRPAWQLVDNLVSRVRPHLDLAGDNKFVTDALGRLRETGGGAQRQRAAFTRRQQLTDVVDQLVWPLTPK